jgi:ADP-heptose:LPS heptosyltransferase
MKLVKRADGQRIQASYQTEPSKGALSTKNKKKKLILRNFQSLGDIVMLTAALRDLHKCYPDRFVTDIRTPCNQLWENSPYITSLDEKDPGVTVLECEYPLIHQSNQRPFHFIHGFVQFFNEKLNLQIKPTEFRGDIHVSPEEKSWFSQVREVVEQDVPFWIIVAGGKNDFTIKWWDQRRFQEVVDRFRGKILFVQVGEKGHTHPPLDGVLDLRGKTDLRQLVRLVYHSQGVLCPVTSLMHLAAAIEVKGGLPKNRPCVVVAGGREPSQWEAYPHHQFIHTNGSLMCCDHGGCWKSRTVPLGDGDEKDRPENLCVDVVGNLPHCMHMITADQVIQRIQMYFDGGVVQYLTSFQYYEVKSVLSQRGGGRTAKSFSRKHTK